MADSDSLVLGRAKRSTAGNRLRALLDKAHSVDAEQGFEEVADDKDFEDTLNQKDVFDDDFESTDEEVFADEPTTADVEKNIRREERTEKQKEKNKRFHDPLAYLKKGPKAVPKKASALATPILANNAVDEHDDDAARKKRRVSVVAPGEELQESIQSDEESETTPDSSGLIKRRGGTGRRTVAGEVRRSALRASTRQDRDFVEERVQQDEARRAINPLRGPRKPHPSVQLTQADLIELALEREEENRESLKDWIKKEEERRASAREAKGGVQGPRLTWISRAEAIELSEPKVVVVGKPKIEVVSASTLPTSTPKAPTPESVGVHSAMVADSTKSPVRDSQTSTSSAIVQAENDNVSTAHIPQVDEHQKTNSDTLANTSPTKPTKSSSSIPVATSAPTETLAKSYLILEDIIGQKAELQAVLGTHADWTQIPFVSTRNRPITRKRTFCQITGKVARYRHPTTMIPYANTQAFQTINKLLSGHYRWSHVTNTFLDTDGHDSRLCGPSSCWEDQGFQVADGLMEEVEGWPRAMGWKVSRERMDGVEIDISPNSANRLEGQDEEAVVDDSGAREPQQTIQPGDEDSQADQRVVVASPKAPGSSKRRHSSTHSSAAKRIRPTRT